MWSAPRPTDAGAAPDVEALVVSHLGLVRDLARTRLRRLPFQIELDDVLAVGALGLLEAAQRFDPDRGIPFGAYARQRITGAIVDYVRREAPMSRGDHARVEAGDLSRLREVEQLDETHVHTLPDHAPNPEAHAIAADSAAQLRDRLRRLPPRERAILIGRYWHDRVFADLTRDHGVNESRICQLAARARRRLRDSWDTPSGHTRADVQQRMDQRWAAARARQARPATPPEPPLLRMHDVVRTVRLGQIPRLIQRAAQHAEAVRRAHLRATQRSVAS